MNTTHGSSFEYQAALEWTVPSRHRGQLMADLTELQMYRAQARQPVPDPDKAMAMKARALHAGATKTQRLHAAMDAAIERHRLQLVAWTDTDTSRACWLTRLMNQDGRTNKDGRPSGWRTVYNYLATLTL